MSIVNLPDGTPSALFQIKPVGDGRFFLEAFGFKSMVFFDKNDSVRQLKLFERLLNEPVVGTVQ